FKTSSTPPDHGAEVIIENWGNMYAAVDYAVAQGAVGIVYSYGLAPQFRGAWEKARRAGLWVWAPVGSNEDVEVGGAGDSVVARSTWAGWPYAGPAAVPLFSGGEDPDTPGPDTGWNRALEVDTRVRL